MNQSGNGHSEERQPQTASWKSSAVGPDDPRVIAALEEYQAACQAGQAPDREQFQARRPDIAAALADCLGGLELVRQAAGDAGAAPGTRLGDFRIVREVGRGGMGVVYEAVQDSLGRQVALKVLSGHALAAPAQLERFRREARAAACLHHTNIVPVFDVGCDRGVHFYAMQLIDGQSLDRVLGELRRRRSGEAADGNAPPAGAADPAAEPCAVLAERLWSGRLAASGAPAAGARGPSPTARADTAADGDARRPRPTGAGLPGPPGEYFRAAARVGVQAAEALAYAHRQGILHRDIKPANLMLDARGAVWVADFGLAKAEGSGELTGYGDVVGTLRYLAPERLDGCSCPRSDIYSLGATLYELLTLRPAFDEPERARLLERLTRGGPPRPRRLNGHIPRDLETIVLKCMAREPTDRYATADALADDLRRFLQDRPIRARRAGLPECAWRWGRRHRAVTVLLAAALVLAVGLGLLALLLWDRQRQTAEALRQADEQRRQAEAGRLLAETNFRHACALLDDAPLRQQLEWLKRQGPRPSPADQELQASALAHFQGLLAEPGPDPGERLLTAQVHIELGDACVFLARRAEAAREYQSAIVLLRPLAAEFPRQAGFRDSLAHCLSYQSWAELSEGRLEEGEDDIGQAIALYEGLREEFDDAPWYRWELADRWKMLGELRRRNGRFQQGEEALRHALALQQRLFDEFPQGGDVRTAVMQAHNDLAWVLAIRPDGQPQHAAEALEHAQAAVALNPGGDDVWHTLGVVHCRLGHWKEALECIEKSRQLEPLLPGTKPGPPTSWDRYFEAMAYNGLGDRENARRCYDEGVRWMEANLPDHADLRRFREETSQALGIGANP